jgi:hypothetical protein
MTVFGFETGGTYPLLNGRTSDGWIVIVTGTPGGGVGPAVVGVLVMVGMTVVVVVVGIVVVVVGVQYDGKVIPVALNTQQ